MSAPEGCAPGTARISGDSHLKAGLVGPSETVPVVDGRLGLSTWQNIFLCEFDGPRTERTVLVTVLRDGD